MATKQNFSCTLTWPHILVLVNRSTIIKQNTVMHYMRKRESLAEHHLCFLHRQRRESENALLPGATSRGSFPDDRVGSAPWPTLPLFLAKCFCWQMSEWRCSICRKGSLKLVKQQLLLCITDWMAKVLLSGLRGAVELCQHQCLQNSSTHFKLPFDDQGHHQNLLLWPVVPCCFSFAASEQGLWDTDSSQQTKSTD